VQLVTCLLAFRGCVNVCWVYPTIVEVAGTPIKGHPASGSPSGAQEEFRNRFEHFVPHNRTQDFDIDDLFREHYGIHSNAAE
jgi:hypothetical protein